MNWKTYIHNLSKRYGGLQRDELLEDLYKLCIKVESETIDKISKAQSEVHDEVLIIPPREIALSMNDQIDSIVSSKADDYNKCLKIMNIFRGRGWYSIKEIPTDLFYKFMQLADTIKEIEFDTDRDWQFFRVVHKDYKEDNSEL
jgi:hypothetical protein